MWQSMTSRASSLTEMVRDLRTVKKSMAKQALVITLFFKSVFPNSEVDIFTDATVFKTGQGTLAEYLVCSSDRIVLRPSHLKPTEASGLSLVGLTAYQALFNVGKLEQGQSIFINGGGTSVGLAAIQLAKATGCVVGASASTQKEELMRSLGVDTVRISYRNLFFYTHQILVH
jgi:NADPH:quinone reductase-like Zn-dependent oxidoreductase